MASIVNNKKYGEGHKVVFKTKLPSSRLNELRKLNYVPGSDEFRITKKANESSFLIEAGSGKDSITLIDKKNKILSVVGSESSINNLFNHSGGSGSSKANTNLLTEIKETFSLVVFRAQTENNKTLKEDEAIKEVERIIPGVLSNYNSTYYESAIKQLVEYKKYPKGGEYEYERQGEDKTKQLYVVARKLTGKLNDNWNPADVWVIKRGFDMEEIYNSSTAKELNLKLYKAFDERNVLPISLKQVEKERAKSSIVDPEKLFNQKLDLDLSYDRTDLSDTFKNFILKTKSGFAIRAGFKASAITLNVSLEGRFIGAGYQTGAVDAKVYTQYMKDKYNYNVRSSAVNSNEYTIAKKELEEIYKKTRNLSNTIKDYEEAIRLFENADKLTKDRFANLISYLYSFLIVRKDFETHMRFVYLSSKKVSADSSVYVIIEQ
jgi:hypothetical protein